MNIRPLRTQIEIGVTYSRITVVKDLGIINGLRTILGRCECGSEKQFNWMNVKSGKSRSCGCLPLEKNTKHGLHNHPLYSVWEGMMDRCYNPNYSKFNSYGGRGVVVCGEWRHSPKLFIEWAINNGWEKGLQLDKDKLSPLRVGFMYSPETCCFITSKENSMYRRNSHIIEHNGKKMCVSEFATMIGMKYPTVIGRLKCGWSIDDIVSIPLFKYDKKLAS